MVDVWVLRLSHRIVRDARITTHVALVSRAFGAKGMYYSGDRDNELEDKVIYVVNKWGGQFTIEYIKSPVSLVKKWKDKGIVVHLTMYGIDIDDVIDEIRALNKDILVIVGSEKVPGIYFELADYNVAIGHQPHSEVAALAIFLDRVFMGKELKLKFEDAEIEIIPMKRGKKVTKKYVKG